MKKLAGLLGLHPLTAVGMIAVDVMLFHTDLGIITWPISVTVATLLMIPCVIMQRFAYQDAWLIALAKSLLVGILTAIPTPLPAVLTGGGGVLGLLGSWAGKDQPTHRESERRVNDESPALPEGRQSRSLRSGHKPEKS